MGNPWIRYMFPVVQFALFEHIYTRTRTIQNKKDGIFRGVEPVNSVYQAKQEPEYPPIIILDKHNLVRVKNKEYALRPLDESGEISPFTGFISPKAHDTIVKALRENGQNIPRKKDDYHLHDELARSGIAYVPVQRIKDILDLEEIDWPEFIRRLIRWDAENKDPRLCLAHKAQLLRGLESRLNAHALICTNAGTGKSIHYHTNGVLIDKATRNAFLGFAKSPTEIYKGTVDGEDLPIGVDQIEVGNWGIMDFMFNVMEYGEATVSSGAVKFTVKSKAPFAFMANPISDRYDVEKGFGVILEHLTRNPAIGRRFGVICYGSDYAVLSNRSTPESLDNWKHQATFFRAIEEAAHSELVKIMNMKEVWDWINLEIPGYYARFLKIIEGSGTNNVRSLFREHGKAGQSRVRAAALQCCLVDSLRDIVLERYDVDEVLERAEELLHGFTELNLESAVNIILNAGSEERLFAEHWFDSCPEYLKEIVYAVEFARRQGILGSSFNLNDIEYKPSGDGYSHLSQCISRLVKRKRGVSLFNEKCKKHFGFSFNPDGSRLLIYLEKRDPIRWLLLPGDDAQEPESEVIDLELSPQEKRNRVFEFIRNNGGVSKEEIRDKLGLTKTEVQLITSAGKRDGSFFEYLGKWRLVE